MIESTSNNWLLDLSKAEPNESVLFYIDNLKKEDIIAAAQKQCGRHGQVQVGFHGDRCYVRKLKSAAYFVSHDNVINTSTESNNITKELYIARRAETRHRFMHLHLKELVSDEVYADIHRLWREQGKDILRDKGILDE